MKYLLCVVVTLVLSACESNWGEYGGYKMDSDSAMDYYIVLDKIDTVLTDYPYYNKGSFITYYGKDVAPRTGFCGNGGRVIGSFVDDEMVAFDSTFILVGQKPLDSICECNHKCMDERFSNVSELPTYKICKNALEASSYYQYWIINKSQNAVYGPYLRVDFLQMREELGVPDELKYPFEMPRPSGPPYDLFSFLYRND